MYYGQGTKPTDYVPTYEQWKALGLGYYNNELVVSISVFNDTWTRVMSMVDAENLVHVLAVMSSRPLDSLCGYL